MKHLKEQDNVLIFDTTLRDGEQSPGATMSHAEKLSSENKLSGEKKLSSEKKSSGAIWWPNLQLMQVAPCCCQV